MDVVSLDLRFALRSLRHHAFFAAVTVVTLGLGIGVVTTMFAVTDAVLLRPIVPDQDRVVRVSKLDVQRGSFPTPLSLHEVDAWRAQSRSFDVMAAVDHAATGPTPIDVGGRVVAAQLAPVSADFFRVAHGGAPLLGRWLTAEDEQRGADVAAVVSEGFWRRAAGGDPAFVGRRLTWAGTRSLVVVGIAPAALDYPLGTEIWAPGAAVFDGRAGRFDATRRDFAQFEILGRLAANVSIDAARAELDVVQGRVAQAFPDEYRSMPVVLEPILDSVVGSGRSVLLALLAAAALVFAIAGVNVAALLLMRAAARRADVAVRVALGAGFGQLLRQTLAEGFVLGALGAVCGLVVARTLLAALQWLAPDDVPRIGEAALDVRVLGFCAAAALAWVLALGTVPLWTDRRLARAPATAPESRVARGTKGLFAFTVAQVAAAVVVAIGAGLLVRTFAHLQAIDRGFASGDLLMVSLLLPEARARDQRALLAFYDELLPQVAALPGVESATPIHMRPGSGTLGLSAPMLFEGQSAEEARTNPWSTWEPVLPSYFETLGVPIVRGRALTAADRRDGAPVAVVSESVARRYWPGQDPIGRRLRFVADSEWPWVTVVGVAADTRYRELTRTWMTVYFPADQFFFFQASSLVVRATAPPAALVPAILQRVRALEPGAAVESAATIETLLARELSRPRTALVVSGIFAAIAIVLAAVGVYGVLSYEVRQRRRELAVRSAIGATPSGIFRVVVRRSLIVGAVGAGAGVLIAASLTHTLSSLLFEVRPLDPAVFLAGAGGLLAVVLLAACIPARRAAAADLVAGLRQTS